MYLASSIVHVFSSIYTTLFKACALLFSSILYSIGLYREENDACFGKRSSHLVLDY